MDRPVAGLTPRLPRAVEADGRAGAVREALAADRRPLWPGSAVLVSAVPWSAPLRAALRAAMQGGQLVLGLDAAAAALAAERAGLEQLAARGLGAPAARVSRVAVLARDGATRFYRGVERLLREHDPRLLVVRADVDAAGLGTALTGRERPVKLALAAHRDTAARLLLALA